MLAGAAGVVAFIRTRRLGSEWKSVILCGILFLLGLGWYRHLPIASMTSPPVNWGYSRIVDGFFHTIMRGQYERPHPADELGRFVEQLWILAKEAGSGLGVMVVGNAATKPQSPPPPDSTNAAAPYP